MSVMLTKWLQQFQILHPQIVPSKMREKVDFWSLSLGSQKDRKHSFLGDPRNELPCVPLAQIFHICTSNAVPLDRVMPCAGRLRSELPQSIMMMWERKDYLDGDKTIEIHIRFQVRSQFPPNNIGTTQWWWERKSSGEVPTYSFQNYALSLISVL